MGSLNRHELLSKKLSNSPILRNNYELDSIIVNMGQIHGELSIFRKYEVFFKFDQIGRRIEVRNNSKTNPRNQKSLDLDQDSRRNHRAKI